MYRQPPAYVQAYQRVKHAGILREKRALSIDLTNPEEKRKFLEYLDRNAVYGYHTAPDHSALEEQRLNSVINALRQGKLKSYEPGLPVNTLISMIPPRLSQADLTLLEMELLKARPNDDVVKSMAAKYKVDENTIKREFIKSKYQLIKRWLTDSPSTKREAPRESSTQSQYIGAPVGPDLRKRQNFVINYLRRR